MTTQYQRGQKVQYKARDELRQEGYHTMTAGRSLGPFDIIAWSSGSVRFIQVKSCQREKFYFEKDELEELVKEPIPKSCRKEVWIWFWDKETNDYWWRKWECVVYGETKNWLLTMGRESLEKKPSSFHLGYPLYPKPF